MSIAGFFEPNKTVVSFEIFPPKPTSPLESVFQTTDELQALRPDFISVTYGAAGGSRNRTLDLADKIKHEYHIEPLAHLTCIVAEPQEIDTVLDEWAARGITSVLALRGDRPQDGTGDLRSCYAKDLVSQLKQRGGFSIGAAAYPEGHPECRDVLQDIEYLRLKADSGADFLITQIFFDNVLFYDFLERADRFGIHIPVSAGIMPVFSAQQVARICSLCGASIPKPLQQLMDRYAGDAVSMEQAGLEYACEQISDLVSHKVSGVHIYTMNRAHLARYLVNCTGLRG